MGSSLNKQVNSNDYNDDYIQNLVKAHQIVIFSKTNCSYCTRAKSALKEMNLNYHSIELDIDKQCPNDNCQNLSKALVLQTRMRTVPQIFVNGKLIGGCTDLESIIKNDEKFKEVFSNKN